MALLENLADAKKDNFLSFGLDLGAQGLGFKV